MIDTPVSGLIAFDHSAKGLTIATRVIRSMTRKKRNRPTPA